MELPHTKDLFFIHWYGFLSFSSYIGKAVMAANQLEDIQPLLMQVGGRHGTRGYNIPPQFFPVSWISLTFYMYMDYMLAQNLM